MMSSLFFTRLQSDFSFGRIYTVLRTSVRAVTKFVKMVTFSPDVVSSQLSDSDKARFSNVAQLWEALLITFGQNAMQSGGILTR